MQHSFSSRPLTFLDWTIAMLFWLDSQHVQSDLCKLLKRSRMSCFQCAQKGPCHIASHLSALTTSRGSHQVQVIGACLHYCHVLHTLPPQLSSNRLHPNQSAVSKRAVAHGPIAEKHNISLQDVLFHHTLLAAAISLRLQGKLSFPYNCQKMNGQIYVLLC